MKTRRVGLVQPFPDAFPSGGDLYNRWILRQAQGQGFPLHALRRDDPELSGGGWALLVWDSLLLGHVARFGDERLALLLHYLPSLDPGLDDERRAALRAVEQRAIALADAVIATGQPVAAAALDRVPGAVVHMCEPGVADAFRRASSLRPPPAARPAPALLTVAHLLPAKGHGHLLEILARLREVPWHWHVVGDGGRCPATARMLREQARGAGLEDRITWHGALGAEAVAALMADCDLFVFPSTFEAYGTVLAEAVAAGLPVLANRVGAAERLVAPGATGFLASVGDWDGFGRDLRLLLTDAGLRDAFREKLRALPVRGWEAAFEDFRGACEATWANGSRPR